MARTNPYAATEWQYVWQYGYDQGFAQPNGTIQTPSVYVGHGDAVFHEGVFYGQEDGKQQGHSISVEPEHTRREGTGIVGDAPDIVHGGWDAATVAVHIAKATVTVGEFGALAVSAFILLISLSEDPEVVHTDPAELGAYLAHACNQHGHAEFYLPYCTATGHHGGGSDGIFQQGLWHGDLYYNWDNAYGEAYQHLINERHWNATGVLHYLPSEPNYMEWLNLVYTAPS